MLHFKLNFCIGKDIFHPRKSYEDPERKYRYSSTLSLTSLLDGDGW